MWRTLLLLLIRGYSWPLEWFRGVCRQLRRCFGQEPLDGALFAAVAGGGGEAHVRVVPLLLLLLVREGQVPAVMAGSVLKENDECASTEPGQPFESATPLSGGRNEEHPLNL